MKTFVKLLIGFMSVFTLTGCFGEEYDFTPPTVLLSDPNTLESVKLIETNIDWNSDKVYKKVTEDYVAFAKSQEPLHFSSKQKMDIEFDSQDFAVEELSVAVWENDKQVELELHDDRSFYFPKEKGKYVLEVQLISDKGNAQYVGNMIIE